MKKLLLVTMFGLVASVPAMASEADAEAGKALVQESCLECHMVNHGPEIYQRGEKGRVHSFPQLSKQVATCVSKLEMDWFDEDIANAAEYLNDEYYKFKK